jgi:hypothetical protein
MARGAFKYSTFLLIFKKYLKDPGPINNVISTTYIETKAQTFRYRSLLSEQNQNVLIWSAYYRNKIRTFAVKK